MAKTDGKARKKVKVTNVKQPRVTDKKAIAKKLTRKKATRISSSVKASAVADAVISSSTSGPQSATSVPQSSTSGPQPLTSGPQSATSALSKRSKSSLIVVSNPTVFAAKSIRPRLKTSFKIESEDDQGCFITGIAISDDGKKFITDQKSLRVFSSDMKLMSILILPYHSTGIAITGETELAITTSGVFIRQIQFIDFSNDALSVSHTLKTDYYVYGITSCPGNIYVTSHSPPSVKKIDKSGKIYWSISGDEKGTQMFKSPYDITSFVVDESIRLAITENSQSVKTNVTLLDGASGAVLAVHNGPGLMRGITSDIDNTIYICYPEVGVVSAMPSDLAEDKVIITTEDRSNYYRRASAHDLHKWPGAIAYDHSSNSLVVSSCYPDFANKIQVYEFR